jgi:hypothetical protein
VPMWFNDATVCLWCHVTNIMEELHVSVLVFVVKCLQCNIIDIKMQASKQFTYVKL